jgi:hypothetical protein
MGLFDFKGRKVDKILHKSIKEITTEECFFVLSYLSRTSEKEVYNSIKKSLEENGDNISNENVEHHAKLLILKRINEILNEEESEDKIAREEYIKEMARIKARKDY